MNILKQRLDKIISSQFNLTRSIARTVIRRGKVSVNGEIIRDAGMLIEPDKCSIVYGNEELEYKKYVYLIMNKPKGVLSASEDKNRKTVVDLVPENPKRNGLFPVGRLDKDTTGLMILTNNGQLAHALLSPKHHVQKEYFFTAAEPLKEGVEEHFREGVTLADGYECKSALITLSPDRLSGNIILTEGKYHQIKRMLGALNNKIIYLERISFGPLTLDKALNRGEWRYLTEGETNLLKMGAYL